MSDDPGLERLRAVTVGEIEQREIVVVEDDPAWHDRFAAEKRRIVDQLGARARSVEHVGSTAVCDLAAKPIVDILLIVDDPADEPAYVPALDRIGYHLRIREPNVYEHRMLRTGDRAVHLHVFGPRAPEVERMLLLRDMLRADAHARRRYEQTKRRLATRRWSTMQHYADAKTGVIEELLQLARSDPTTRRQPRSR